MLIKPLIVGLVLVAVTAHVSASPSLLETYDQALANDPQLAIARLNAENAQQDVTTGYANVLPDVTANGSYRIGAAAAHVPIAGYAHLNGQLSAQLSVGDLGYEIPWICTIHTHPYYSSMMYRLSCYRVSCIDYPESPLGPLSTIE